MVVYDTVDGRYRTVLVIVTPNHYLLEKRRKQGTRSVISKNVLRITTKRSSLIQGIFNITDFESNCIINKCLFPCHNT